MDKRNRQGRGKRSKIAVGVVAVATLAAGIFFRNRSPRPAKLAADNARSDIADLYEAGL